MQSSKHGRSWLTTRSRRQPRARVHAVETRCGSRDVRAPPVRCRAMPPDAADRRRVGRRTARRRTGAAPAATAAGRSAIRRDEILAAASRLFGERGCGRHDDGRDRRRGRARSSRRSTTTSAAGTRSSRRSSPRPTWCRSSSSTRIDRRRRFGPRRSSTGSCAATSRRCAPALRHQRDPPARRPRPRRFAGYWTRAAPPRAPARRASCATGVDAGELRAVDPRLTALTIMSNDEGVQNWFRLGDVSADAGGDRRGAGRRSPSAACWRSALARRRASATARRSTERSRRRRGFERSSKRSTPPFARRKRAGNSPSVRVTWCRVARPSTRRSRRDPRAADPSRSAASVSSLGRTPCSARRLRRRDATRRHRRQRRHGGRAARRRPRPARPAASSSS